MSTKQISRSRAAWIDNLKAKLTAKRMFDAANEYQNSEVETHYDRATSQRVLPYQEVSNWHKYAQKLGKSAEKAGFEKVLKESMADGIIINKEFDKIETAYEVLKEKEGLRYLREENKVSLQL